MSRVVALRIDLPSSSSPQATRRKPAKDRNRTAVDSAQAIAAGEEADRLYFKLYCKPHAQDEDYYFRPVGNNELDALLDRKGVRPLPGIPRPRVYAFMESTYSSASAYRPYGVIERILRPCSPSAWRRLVRDARCGLRTSAEYLDRDAERTSSGWIIFETVSADWPSAEST